MDNDKPTRLKVNITGNSFEMENYKSKPIEWAVCAAIVIIALGIGVAFASVLVKSIAPQGIYQIKELSK